MATHIQAFASADGGFQGTNALVDNSSEFYLDLGKTEAFATLDLSDPTATPNLIDYGTVLGLEVVILNSHGNLGGGTDANAFDTALFHTTDNEYTDVITTEVDSDDPVTRTIGGPTNTWDKTWTATDINGIKVRLNNPQEPNGTSTSIALKGTFIFVRVTYVISIPNVLTIQTGRINLQQGNISII